MKYISEQLKKNTASYKKVDDGSRDKLIDFLRDRRARDFLFKSFFWQGSWAKLFVSRVFAFDGFFKNFFTARELFLLLLPTEYKPRYLKDRFAAFINNEARKKIQKFINNDGSVNWYGKKFFPPLGENYHELAGLLFELAISDQYHANEFIGKDDIILDAGANIGAFSVFAANIAKNGKVFAFEPAKITFSILKKNAEYYKNITCFPYGLSDKNETKNIYVPQSSLGGSTIEDSGLLDNKDGYIPEETRLISIDNFVKEKNLDRVDFLKIDTEGYEEKILKGAAETITKFSPIIAVSAYHKPDDKKAIPEIIKNINPNYTIVLSKRFEEDFICYVSNKKQ